MNHHNSGIYKFLIVIMVCYIDPDQGHSSQMDNFLIGKYNTQDIGNYAHIN